MDLSVHVLDVPGFVLAHTPHEVVVVIPAHLDPRALQAMTSLLLSAGERTALARVRRDA